MLIGSSTALFLGPAGLLHLTPLPVSRCSQEEEELVPLLADVSSNEMGRQQAEKKDTNKIGICDFSLVEYLKELASSEVATEVGRSAAFVDEALRQADVDLHLMFLGCYSSSVRFV